ncbi:MAG: phosphate/phosphite/phosphonate ABC transporter substrate-binding protein [Myxococcota bacterium]|jgi:phosphonate transport system substrate-binding protein|nr:phosphate/phosphite/phosphonate ABC transporter substrate-binding protein [Myxococcota bacterium]
MNVRTPAVLLFLTLVLGLAGCKSSLGTEDKPIRIYVVPSELSASTRQAGQKLVDHLNKETGLHYSIHFPDRYIDVVVALGDKKADIAFMNNMSYLLANERFGAEAALAVERASRNAYSGMIVVRADSGIEKLEDLEDKRIAIVDVYSVSGYIMPALMLSRAGIQARETITAGNHADALRAVYDGKADAAFSFHEPPIDGKSHDARNLLGAEHPDVMEVLEVLALTETIPNEPVVFRKGLPPEMRKKTLAALLSFVESPEGKEVFRAFHEIGGFIEVDDSHYDSVRDALSGLGKKLDEMVPGGGILEVKHVQEPMPPLGN